MIKPKDAQLAIAWATQVLLHMGEFSTNPFIEGSSQLTVNGQRSDATKGNC
jgi:hypothetical protein